MTDVVFDTMTIVVPVFNRARLVERSLDSLRNQTWRPIHVIVVDNGSSDDSLDVVRHWKSANECEDFSVEIISDPRRGAAYARQTGLDRAATDKIMFFDSDDVMRPGCVEACMHAWQRDPQAGVVIWRGVRHAPSSDVLTHSVGRDLLVSHLVHSVMCTLAYAVKTDLLRRAGGWRGEFPTWNDLETATRILLLKPRAVIISGDPLVEIFPQKVSITGTSYSEKAGLWEKSLDAVSESIRSSGVADSRRLLSVVSYRRVILAADYAKENRLDLARPLYRKALRQVPAARRPLLWFAYHWTRLGFRGAFSIVGPML